MNKGKQQQGSAAGQTRRYGIWIAILIILSSLVYFGTVVYKGLKEPGPGKPQTLERVAAVDKPADAYDVIVVGTDPEGVAAAVSASMNGLKTLLVDGRDREILGGLMTLGWLNSLDHNYHYKAPVIPGKPEYFNKGIFQKWYEQVEGDSFDVVTAANAFNKLVKNEKNIDVLLKTKEMLPWTEPGEGGRTVVKGMKITLADGTAVSVPAKAVIDATQDGDVYAAAGAPFTLGREDLGDPKARMAVTLVFKLGNVTPEVWSAVKKRLEDDGDPNTGANELSAWGYVEMQNYPSTQEGRVKMRGLNIGRQNDGTALVNALQIFDIDPLSPASVAEAFEIGKKELPHVIDHMKKLYPEFKDITLAGTAPELYVRESRHLIGEYRLTMVDVLENRDQWDRIAFGSYPVDIQRISAKDNGAVMTKPIQYAIPFRSIVPKNVDGLLVVGRSASFDSLPHGSARVIPVGMATGEAAGAAVKLAVEKGMTFRELSQSKDDIAELQARLNKQGMELAPFKLDPNEHMIDGRSKLAYMLHPAYPGLKAAVSMSLTTSGYSYDFKLDEPSNPQRLVNHMLAVRRIHGADKFKGDPNAALKSVETPDKAPLTLDQATYTILTTVGVQTTRENAAKELESRGWIKPESKALIQKPESLTNGQVFMLIRDIVEAVAGRTYD
ncbi:FAD-dependent oxidoreductase [Paenibacillus thermoaerophilus]|uniref:FAD-dependent oxidoreductase n=1 Tax=Paenibacillus thermoaerophilus TaxID=1215385 RepID=A0ABW2V0H9_9BACL|nr:FAD-dependent oxidoreductase [Paenibacillus thermoaerophilus]TMV17320.1 FAD-dependent oxidoreductase [Paenibacillus thermoaerophilus]